MLNLLFYNQEEGIVAKRIFILLLAGLCFVFTPGIQAKELQGVSFPQEKIVDGKTLTLNGVALRKALGIIKVFAGGFYLETPTTDYKTAIESEQVKYFYLEYLTSKATAKKLQDGFLKSITKANPPELVAAQQKNIELYASWLDQDMKPGSTSESIYVPGKGLTLIVNGKTKGTISDVSFARMYYRYSLGKKADKKLRKGYLGL